VVRFLGQTGSSLFFERKVGTKLKHPQPASLTTGVAVWKFMFRRYSLRSATLRNCKAKPLIATLMFCAVSATGAAMDRGQFKNVPPEIREWFENMRSPKGMMWFLRASRRASGH